MGENTGAYAPLKASTRDTYRSADALLADISLTESQKKGASVVICERVADPRDRQKVLSALKLIEAQEAWLLRWQAEDLLSLLDKTEMADMRDRVDLHPEVEKEVQGHDYDPKAAGIAACACGWVDEWCDNLDAFDLHLDDVRYRTLLWAVER